MKTTLYQLMAQVNFALHSPLVAVEKNLFGWGTVAGMDIIVLASNDNLGYLL